MKTVRVADFTNYPGPRYEELGEGSGEEFRDKFLWPAFQQDKDIVIDLDGVAGYGSSFLEEAFGGLIRTYKIPKTDLNFLMSHIKSTYDPTLKDEVIEYIEDELRRQQ